MPLIHANFQKTSCVCLSSFFLLLFGGISAQESFAFVVLPDTQTYVEEYPEIYLNQMEWIAQNKDRFAFVLHEGDITQNNSNEEWEIAKKGFELLDGKVPYIFALGNHDMGSGVGKFADTRNTALANAYFSVEELKENASLITSFPAGTVDNLASTFDVVDKKWLVIALEFGPRDKTLQWAEKLIEQHSDHNVILVTHAYLYEDGTLHDGEDWWQPQGYGVGKATGGESVNNGAQLWDKLVKKHKNILLVFSGHVLKSGVGTLVGTGVNGNKVYQLLANYQKGVTGSENGGNGYLRIIKVDLGAKTIGVKTYSPYLDTFKTEPEQEFVFENVQF